MKTTTVQCPHCQKTVLWNVENPFKPFCSERCKLIDLGDWLAQRHAIAGDHIIDDVNDAENDSASQ